MSKTTRNNVHAVSDAPYSRDRLAQISHYFLSNENQRLPAWENTAVIPVLLGSKNDDYVVYELNHAFNDQKGSSSMVLNIENHLIGSGHSPTLANAITPTSTMHKEGEKIRLPDYCLIPVSSPSVTLALRSDRLLIAVQASLDGVRVAYDQLASIALLDTNFTICVIMLGAKTKPEAKRFFSFLCNNTQSLLSLRLECAGYLLQDNDHTDAVEDAETEVEEMATNMSSIVINLLRRFNSSGKKIIPSHLASPARPAARPDRERAHSPVPD